MSAVTMLLCGYSIILKNLSATLLSSSSTLSLLPTVTTLLLPLSALLASPEFINNVQEQNKKVSAALLEKAKSICSSQGVNAETISEVGDAQQAICDAVQKLNITLLILGDRGIGKIKRAFLGSVSNHCVNNAKCPVLVVKKSS
ncbi:universal stress protein A-like protein isoform X2 [Vitis vinifera]|uniref:universal stress protein A-like protein isoform X2 n=1 Tax=Vitis vinifera TaxID=29760 RepID=UPI002882F661|nr:universal stress protein A-like protein isoform X2 [Vitis vinifera]